MKPSLLLGAAFAVLALVTLLGATDTVRAQTFNPTLEFTLDDNQAGANSGFVANFNIPEGDVNIAGVVSFIPPEWGVTPGDEIPIGAVVGTLVAEARLGIINAACNNSLPVAFTMLNSSIDISDTVEFEDADDNLVEDFFEDKDESGLQDAFEKYPSFITRVLVDEDDQPQQPLRRAAGITVIAGVNVLLQFVIFEPGTFIDENIANAAELGYPTVTLLQNLGDPDTDPIPGAITDFCTPLTTTNTAFGVTRDNPCTDVPGTILDVICTAFSAPFELTDEGESDPDEGGHVLFTNPPEGTYTFTVIAAGQRDADGDSYENSLDTCAFVTNVGDPRVQGDGDEDSDGLDAACDPNDDPASGGTNSDEDLDGYLNRQDNCPLVANGEEGSNQRDTDDDAIGDDCDPNPNDADSEGELTFATIIQDVVIGPGGPPAEDETPTPSEDDDGGSDTLIIVIIVVIAVVVVGGGGAFLYMRRGSGGGGSGGAAA